MNVPENVINDLLPLYFSGEASPETRNFVEEYFRENPRYAQQARHAAEALQTIGMGEDWRSDTQLETKILKRAKRLLRIQSVLFAIACTFTLNALSLGFSFDVANGHIHAYWLAIPGQREVVLFLLLLAVATWSLYVFVRRRVKMRVLG
jgi:hypothetical protein